MITPSISISTIALPSAATSPGRNGIERDETGPRSESTIDPADQETLRELQARDREVRAHEQAHLSAAGSYAKGGASFTYERGPDQRLYAVGGEVQVDTSKVTNDPVATLRKAQVIRRAALAPAAPSAQDRRVAAEASRMEAEARQEIAAQKASPESTSAADPSDAGEMGEKASVDTDRSTENTVSSCPACGGAHSATAHDGMVAYAANS